MSAKLLKQAIEIVEEDLQPIPNKKGLNSLHIST